MHHPSAGTTSLGRDGAALRQNDRVVGTGAATGVYRKAVDLDLLDGLQVAALTSGSALETELQIRATGLQASDVCFETGLETTALGIQSRHSRAQHVAQRHAIRRAPTWVFGASPG